MFNSLLYKYVVMACFWLKQNITSTEIPEVTEISNVIYYKILINVGEIKWHVLHRYSEFYELHNQLVTYHGLSKDILPSKKVIRNKCPIFLETRRKDLEVYLQKILNFLKKTMPQIFLEFLNFHVYDIFFLLQKLANKFFLEGDILLSTSNSYLFSPLELHAISECFRKALPAIENNDTRFDFTHVLDFCSQLKTLLIKGSNTNYLDSNFQTNSLNYELSSFKVVVNMKLTEVNLGKIYSVGNLRHTVSNLEVHKSNMIRICEILQCDVIHKFSFENDQMWHKLEHLDLSNNNLTEIDESIKLVPQLKTLILRQNKISSISDISILTKLTLLDISGNLISICDNLHTKVGNILTLNISQNSLKSVQGFEKLYSLENLDLSCNKIKDIKEVIPISALPCLENLVLTGNNIATSVDYRIKVLELFGDRAKEICLDNEKPTQSELDKVSVLQALRIVKECKTPNLGTKFMK